MSRRNTTTKKFAAIFCFVCTKFILVAASLMVSMTYKKWLMPVLVGLLLFGNHYVRDSVGALEKQMETELNISEQDYAILNAVYFFPNIITPLIAGMFTEKLGGVSNCFLYSVIVAAIGHFLFALGVQFSNKPLIFVGRGIGGTVYEIVDAMMPIAYLGPMFLGGDFQIVVGFMQIFIRMGSVVNFNVSPYLYIHYNLKVAFWVAAIIGMLSVPFFLLSRQIEFEYLHHKRHNSENTFNTVEGDDQLFEIELHNMEKQQQQQRTTNKQSSSSFSVLGEDDDENQQTQIDDDSPNTSDDITFNPINNIRIVSDQSNDSSLDQQQQSNKYLAKFLEFLPLDKFSTQFYLYLLSGSFLYGAIVPFWFIGSRYMQERLGFSVVLADQMVAVPEFLVILVGFPLGLTVSRYQFSLRTKLTGVFVVTLMMAIGYTLLVLSTVIGSEGHTPNADLTLPLVSVLLLGLGFAIAASLYWGSITEVSGTEYLTVGSGLVSCGVNLLPAVIPPILSCFATPGEKSSHANILSLVAMSVFSSLFAILAAYPQVVDYLMCGCCCRSNINSVDTTNTINGATRNAAVRKDLKYGKLSTTEQGSEGV